MRGLHEGGSIGSGLCDADSAAGQPELSPGDERLSYSLVEAVQGYGGLGSGRVPGAWRRKSMIILAGVVMLH